MILFADRCARVIGAAHAGWKGALTGVIEATVAAMERLGARRGDVVAALGPCIGRASYEVGPEFVAAFAAAGEDTARYFTPSRKAGHSMFDLNAYIAERAARAGVGASRTWRSTPTPTSGGSSATAAQPIAASRTTAG